MLIELLWVFYLISGVVGMFCGSCMYDNVFVCGLNNVGFDV